MNRRGFLKQTALGATTPSAVSLAQPRPAGPNERIGVGLIGCGGKYIRTRCDFEVRWTSLPNTDERDHE